MHVEYLWRTVTYQTVKAMDQQHQDDWLFSNWQNLKGINNSKQDNQLDNLNILIMIWQTEMWEQHI